MPWLIQEMVIILVNLWLSPKHPFVKKGLGFWDFSGGKEGPHNVFVIR
jgi:hypothetical protein